MAFNYNAGYVQYPQPYGYGNNQTYAPASNSVPPFQINQTSQSGSFTWVQGEAGAKSYPVAPGNRIALFDSENPVVYIKSTDYNGRPLEMEIYDLVKRETIKQEPEKVSSVDLSSYITRDELKTFVAEEVERAMSEISSKPTSRKRKEDE